MSFIELDKQNLGLKQNSGDKRCLAIVAAMAFNTTPEDFELFCLHEPPYSEWEFAHYAFKKQAICGFGFDIQQQKDFNDNFNMTVTINLKEIPCFIAVESEAGEPMGHAIYWDTKQVWDPNPMTPNGRSLDSYKIKRIYPIIKQ